MAISSSLFKLILLFLTIHDLFMQSHGLNFGINYGQIANNLPSHSRVAALIKSLNVTRIKLYDADPNVLSTFSNSNVEFMIAIGNDNLQNMRDPIKAQTWIQQNVQPYISKTKITAINVGNEVLGNNDLNSYINLLPAMQSVYNALVNLGLSQQVTVTTSHSYVILSSSFPPSSGSFREDLVQYIQPLLSFHAQTKSPLLINAYPFFAYKGDPEHVSLNYVLFQPNPGSVDPATNLHYDNMLYAQIDAVYAAIKALGHNDIEVKISETGWPSKGDADEVGASLQNAEIYHTNLLKRIAMRQGTPAKSSVPVDIYVFALFNEDLKPGPSSEKNYGLYYPDGTPVYSIGLQQSQGGGYFPEMVIESKSNILSNNFVFYILTLFLVFIWEISRF
ncbi:glucan endo-1,3-beta-glucosidase 14-like [Vicia villosa]|uniref:glucan endo-1,3-beta-glucosidase 14-like n=1 Tax=Vicia villosa TaxID=3911 RepID=UPI00273C218D|nr:glucan endo-1,3-beta-glucosidase 14-like [Vicia villosa]